MNIRAVTHVISYMIGVISLAMLAAAGISFYYGEPVAAKGLLAAAGVSLFCARARGMRPQWEAYDTIDNAKLRALFDACGPERKEQDDG